jgi:hypothetical protein
MPYDVRVAGIVALPDFKAVLLEVHHRSLDKSNAPPFLVKQVGRKLVRTTNLSGRMFSFRSQAALSTADVIHAYDVLLAWQNLKVQLLGNDSFRVVAVRKT